MILIQDYYSTEELAQKSIAWKRGFKGYIKDPWNYKNPYPTNRKTYEKYSQGWSDARFHDAVEGGYYDWL